MTERIGLIGLGIMGKPMSQHLLEAGYPLIVLDVVKPAVNELVGCQTGGLACRGRRVERCHYHNVA